MILNLLHNKIIKDTITEGFTRCLNEDVILPLAQKYGDELVSVQMYEDYLKDGFTNDGYFYYPLTVALRRGIERRWVRWSVANKKSFEGGIPYSYIGDGHLAFEFADDIPVGFEEKLLGRGIYFEGGCAPLKIQSVSNDKTFLAGKYSQTFIDELDRQISREIERAFSVSGIENSGIELLMTFAPETYMEHVVDNVTYRRLLITARACAARDFWIKWTKSCSLTPASVSDNITGDEVTFEIAFDVPEKIREKEYRFLVRASADKYQSAMTRKNITEWKDLIKRVIKRGELTLVEPEIVEAPKTPSELTYKLNDVLSGFASEKDAARKDEASAKFSSVEEKERAFKLPYDDEYSAPINEPMAEKAEDVSAESETDYINTLLRNALGITQKEEEEKTAEENTLSKTAAFSEPMPQAIEEEIEEDVKVAIEPLDTDEILRVRELELRRKIEEELREKLRAEAEIKAREEAEELRREKERLKAENERLAEAARLAEEERARKEAEIEARRRQEEIERERLAEAARLAVLEKERIEAERAERERRMAEDAERRRAEEERILAEERVREARRLEDERIRAEMGAKARAEREAKEAEARALAEKEREAKPKYTYTHKTARLIFRRPVDPNITKRIHEIIVGAIKYFHKEDVYIKIKATVPDPTTVNLDFVRIPEEETELLVNIIKLLGKSDLGIIKVFLE